MSTTLQSQSAHHHNLFVFWSTQVGENDAATLIMPQFFLRMGVGLGWFKMGLLKNKQNFRCA